MEIYLNQAHSHPSRTFSTSSPLCLSSIIDCKRTRPFAKSESKSFSKFRHYNFIPQFATVPTTSLRAQPHRFIGPTPNPRLDRRHTPHPLNRTTNFPEAPQFKTDRSPPLTLSYDNTSLIVVDDDHLAPTDPRIQLIRTNRYLSSE